MNIMFSLKNASSPVTRTDIDEVEKRFGFKFPNDFWDLYLHFNGGQPDRNRFVDGINVYIVDEFFPIKHGIPGLTLESNIQFIKADQLLPDYLIPFAINPGGDYFCFSTRENDRGSIFIYRMDFSKNPERGAIYLSSSLGEFLEKLISKT
jgi:hypothetical protein